MKRIVSAVLCAVMLFVLAACGASASPDADANAPASALELLETVWNSYSDDEKFPAAGGDYSEENMRDGGPGNFSIIDADILDSALGFPAAEAGKIDGAASLVHMMNLNTFTCGAFHAKESGDVTALCGALRENILARRWMCGFPEKLVIVTVGDYIVSVFGHADPVDTFTAKLAAAYPNAKTVSDDPIV